MGVAPPPTTDQPILVGYQRRWLRDRSKRKVFVKARRIGGSFVVALECAMAASGFTYGRGGKGLLYKPQRGTDQRIVSASHAQAKELLEEVGRHLEVLSETVIGRPLIAQQSAERITLTNGARCYALAPNPRTVRGGKGDLTLDEFGVMPFSDKVWAAAKSITDPTLGRPWGYKLRVVGTPLGDDNWFYKLAKTDAGNRFSRHFVDVHQAVKDGFPADIEALREEAGDPDIFAQEYECAFLSAAARYISAELYERCLYAQSERPTNEGIGYAGMDVARKPTGDLSAIVELRRIAKVLYHDRTETRRGASWEDQDAWVAEVLTRCQRMALDATGMGMKFAEDAQRRHGGRIEPVEFTGKSKEMLATGLRLSMDSGKLRLRDDDPELRRDVLSLRREMTKAGNVRYDAPRTAHGHADRAWALALAVHSAGRPIPTEAGDVVDNPSEAEALMNIF